MDIITEKFKEVVSSVLPITLIVVFLHFTLTPMETHDIVRFLLGALMIIIGLTIFLIGVDTGLTPIGETMGSSLAKSNKISVVAVSGLLLGFFISVAEPDLHILAGQVDTVTAGVITKFSIVVVVSVGVAVMIAIGLVRIVMNFPLNKLFTIIYAIILILGIFTSPEFLAIAFDSSGATTGALTVPFMLALAVGVSRLKKDSIASESDSFGLVGMASSGAIIAVMAMSVIAGLSEISGSLETQSEASTSIIQPFIDNLPRITAESAFALAPIVIIFLIAQKVALHLSKTTMRRIMFGVLFTFVGLVLFMLGVNAGFMEVGALVGYKLASMESKVYVVVVAFFLGMVTILAEPAVSVLTHQIEDVTSGSVKRKIVMASLAIGVAFSVSLSILRIIVPGIQLWHYLLPGYIISIALSHLVSPLFVGIAFDSGGVASGPMAATFILAFAQGTAEAIEGANVLIDGFGIIAMIAMTPLIALQILGLVYKVKSQKKGVETNES